jgi:mannose-6-phosphate isomerase-like protein (cupin superfamily)
MLAGIAASGPRPWLRLTTAGRPSALVHVADTLTLDEPRREMDAWEFAAIDAARDADRGRYREFMRVPDLSAGLYVLEAGATDPQSPHTEDELYYVVSGRAMVTVGDDTRPVVTGSLVFVAAAVPHHFHDIEERLELLVVFGPAEGSRG